MSKTIRHFLESKSILLLTACVNPKGMCKTALQDKDLRLKHYIYAISYYLNKTDFKIVVVENTSFDFSIYFNKSERLELLSFDGNNYSRQKGKGYGEGAIIKYALEHSLFITKNSCILKVTGRHIIHNINSIFYISTFITRLRRTNKFICAEIPYHRFVRSDLFISDYSFLKDFFLPNSIDIDDSKKYYFEVALFDALIKFKREKGFFLYLPLLIDQSGISGSDGKALIRIPVKEQIKEIIRSILYLIKIKKVTNI